MIIVKGSFFQKTHQGFFKDGFLVLKNQELYLYNDQNCSFLNQTLILSPNVFVEKGKEEIIGPKNKYYPIELYLGGQITNNGKEKSTFHEGNYEGVFTLYF